MYDTFHLKPDVEESQEKESPHEIKGDLTFKNVHFGYEPGLSILKGFDLQISPGEKVALVGWSGSGKSTIVKLIGRFYDPWQGEIELDGISLKRLSFKDIRQALGFVFQETYLFGTTIADNILFGNPDVSMEEIVKAAKAAHAHEFIMELPQGYDTVVGERGICVRCFAVVLQKIAHPVHRRWCLTPVVEHGSHDQLLAGESLYRRLVAAGE